MSAHAYRRLLVIAVVLGMVASLWLLPRGFSFGSTVPPQPIELRSGPPGEPSAPVAPAPPPGVDDDDATDDDGDDDADRPTSRRADLRGQRVDAPATGSGRVGDDADDDDDDGPDDSDDDEADDDEGDDD